MVKAIVKEQKNYEFCQATLRKMNEAQDNFMERAKELYEIKNLNLYRPAWDSFEEYCMEIKSFKYKSVMKLIAIYELFVLKFGFSPARITEAGGWSNVAETLPVVKNKKDAEHWLQLATEKPRQHLRQDVKEKKTGIDMRDCKHKNVIILRCCNDCGLKERVHSK